jgi:glycosyltransferase involved in cell wall biosynthesis
MDVLVLPSRTTPQWKEQFGHVLIEAMACGTPVIGSNSGAIPDVIDAAGLLFPEGDVDALAAHLCRLANNPKELHLMSQRGRERVADMYTHERIAEQTMEVYRSVTQFSKTFAPK